jgi:cytochrome-b5 reductase
MKLPLFFGASMAVGAAFNSIFKSASPSSVVRAYGLEKMDREMKADSHHRDQNRKNIFDYNFRPFVLGEVINLAEDVAVFRFLTPDPEDEFNLIPCSTLQACFKTGAFIIEQPMRFYTPITANGEKGYFDILVKKQPNGRFTEHLFSMEAGETLLFRCIQYKMKYAANRWSHVGMIGGGTGITPLLQVIQASLATPEDKTKLSLLFANKSEDKILLKGILDKMAAESHGRFDINYIVDKAGSKDWKGYVGHVNGELIKKHMPPPAQDTLVLVCGPDGMMNAVVGAAFNVLKAMSGGNPQQPAGANLNNVMEVGGIMGSMGYTRDNTYRF